MLPTVNIQPFFDSDVQPSDPHHCETDIFVYNSKRLLEVKIG